MKDIKWPLLALAIIATLCMMGIGIAVAEESIIGILAAIIALIVVMGIGFKTKKKMRENGTL
ncbi:YlaF family protein [Cytobacillus sp.]|uniref:YlaF family protein n=1 Tax=Cytobacillus sp. TaxID=2675269 RepID=UPI0028BD3A7F|nr:YlaF family protein [Cytobacillus sp.]